MAFFPLHIAHQICSQFYHTDIIVRRDLSRNRVVGERDYLSRYLALLEYPPQSLGTYPYSYRHQYFVNNFPGPLEQKFGCDSFFVFKYNNTVKILAVEGKYPRFHIPKYPWDQRGPGATLSHFEDQLIRQNLLIRAGIPVLEMFLFHEQPGTLHPYVNGMDILGSSFVTHGIASAMTIRRRVWTHAEAITIIDAQSATTPYVNIAYFLYELLNCKIGTAYNTFGGQAISIDAPIDGEPLNIPLLNLYQQDQEKSSFVGEFMSKVGIRNMGYIEYADNVEWL